MKNPGPTKAYAYSRLTHFFTTERTVDMVEIFHRRYRGETYKSIGADYKISAKLARDYAMRGARILRRIHHTDEGKPIQTWWY